MLLYLLMRGGFNTPSAPRPHRTKLTSSECKDTKKIFVP